MGIVIVLLLPRSIRYRCSCLYGGRSFTKTGPDDGIFGLNGHEHGGSQWPWDAC